MYLRNSKNLSLKALYIIFLAFLVGVKPFGWPDEGVYINYFEYAQTISYSQIFFENFDPFFLFLNKVFSDASFFVFTTFLSIFTLMLKFFFIQKKYPHWIRVVILYCSYLLWLHDYVQIRIALALAFFLVGWFVFDVKLLKILMMILACATHVSIFILLLFFFAHKYFGTAKVLFFFVFIILFMSGFLFSGKTGFYKIDNYVSLLNAGCFDKVNVFATMPLLQLVVVFIILYFKKYRRLYFHRVEFAASVSSVFCFYLFLKVPVFAYRLSELFLVFFVIILSEFTYKNNLAKFIYFLFFVLGLKTSFLGEGSLFSLFT